MIYIDTLITLSKPNTGLAQEVHAATAASAVNFSLQLHTPYYFFSITSYHVYYQYAN